MRRVMMFISCFFYFLTNALADETREILVPIREFISPLLTQNVLNKPKLTVKMIIDEGSPTGYKIPKNINEFDEMMKVALGGGYEIFVEKFPDFICNKLPQDEIYSIISFYNLVGFLNKVWLINSDDSPANKILGANYVFFEVDNDDYKIYSILAKIYDDKNKDLIIERWPTYCSPYYYK